MIDTKEESVNDNCSHYEILESLRLNDLETLKSETVDGLNWNDFWICVNK